MPPPPRAQPAGTPLLAGEGLHKRYTMGGKPIHVLRGVDLALEAGEWVAILGASGSGKSTLLHLLGGLDRPDQGEIDFQGERLSSFGPQRLNRYRNQHVGFVFQFYHLLPELTARQNVLIAAMVRHGLGAWLSARSSAGRRAEALLDQLELGDRHDHRPQALSGGERQRVAIARALVNEPALLLADEPTGNLDQETGGKILEVFRTLHAGGQTILMVTHDRQIASAADRIVHLAGGRITAEP